jgi:hypothetical protein
VTYIAGVQGFERFGIRSDGPRVECNGCGLVRRIDTDRLPPAWVLDGKAPPGWRLKRDGDKRTDWCPQCKDGAVRP